MAEKLRTIRLYGALGAKYGRELKFSVHNPAEAIRALCVNFKDFEKTLLDESFSYAVLVGRRHLNPNKELHDPPGSGDIRIVPVPAGAKRGGLFQVILGAALITVSFMAPITMSVWGSIAFSMGTSLALGGVAQMLSPQPNMNMSELPENKASDLFNGPINTVAQGNPVPIFYGEGIVGSSVISAGITAVDS